MEEIDKKDSENSEKIKVIPAEDEKLKILGELLSNKSSRDMIKLLMNKEVYTNEIATTLNMRISLVMHHLKKLEEIGLLLITEKQIVRKGNKHRYFKMIPNLLILPTKTKEEIHKNGFLKRLFKDEIKFVMIGVVSFLVWIYNISAPTVYSITSNDNYYTIPLLIIVLGLISERLWTRFKKIKK